MSYRHTFALSVTLLQCFGIAILVMVGVWTGHYLDGFAWDGSLKEFNYHPVFMIVSMIFLNSQAMIAYRVFSNDNKLNVKLLHMSIQAIAFGFGVIGLKAVFDFHNENDINNMYSLHSWIGMSTFVLFSCQLVCGFLGFLYPTFPDAMRAAYLKVHVFFGTSIILMAVAACLTGITEKALWTIKGSYQHLPGEAVLVNILGAFLIIHTGLTYFITTNDNFRRASTSEERQPLVEHSDETESKQ